MKECVVRAVFASTRRVLLLCVLLSATHRYTATRIGFQFELCVPLRS